MVSSPASARVPVTNGDPARARIPQSPKEHAMPNEWTPNEPWPEPPAEQPVADAVESDGENPPLRVLLDNAAAIDEHLDRDRGRPSHAR